MTEGTKAVGAPTCVDPLDVIASHEDLCRAVLRLGQVARLHQAEAARTIRGGTSMTSREVGDAWDSANVLLAEAAAELDRVQATMAAQIRAVVEVVSLAEDAATGRRR